MATFNIPAQTVLAHVEKDSPAQTVPANITAATIQLTDPNGVWPSTAGNVERWGLQKSEDGGATWKWWLYQDNIPFGTLGRGGAMPALGIASGQIVAAAGQKVRLAVLADADIVLGATVTTAP